MIKLFDLRFIRRRKLQCNENYHFISHISFVSSRFSLNKNVVSNSNIIISDNYFMNSFCFWKEESNVNFWYFKFIRANDIKFSSFYFVELDMIELSLFKNNFDIKFIITIALSSNWNFVKWYDCIISSSKELYFSISDIVLCKNIVLIMTFFSFLFRSSKFGIEFLFFFWWIITLHEWLRCVLIEINLAYKICVSTINYIEIFNWNI